MTVNKNIKLEPGFLKETLRYLEKYLNRKNIVEICINREYQVLIEDTKGSWKEITDKNLTKDRLMRIIKNIGNFTQQEYSDDYPVVLSYIPQWGFRFAAAFGNAVAENGIMISIRIGNTSKFPLEGYFGKKLEFEKEVEQDPYKGLEKIDKIKQMMKNGENMLISGGTSTGKTTMLNSLIVEIPEVTRIITLENMVELSLDHTNTVRLLSSESTSVGYKVIMNLILKSRPDRLLIGELTPDLSQVYMRMANTGHKGTCTTIHADSPSQALAGLYRNLQYTGSSESEYLMKEVAQVVKYVIQCQRTGEREISADIYKTGVKNGEFTAEMVA